MIGRKVIQVTWIAAAMMFCHDARYLLVNLSGGNERASNELINPLGKMIGNIVCNIFYNKLLQKHSLCIVHYDIQQLFFK